MMPTSLPCPSTTGTPEIWNFAIKPTASRSVASGVSVIGLRIIPLSDRFTRSISDACLSIGMFLWITPMPPARAIAIAISLSVTVSIAAATSGTLSVMPRVSREPDVDVLRMDEGVPRRQQHVVERQREVLTHARCRVRHGRGVGFG